jgi:hypothetical protein
VKIPLETARQIATALGDSSDLYLAEKAIADNFLYNEILKQVLALRAVDTIAGLHSIEKDALISRLRPRVAQAKAMGTARWSISTTESLARDLFIRASCDSCSQSMTADMGNRCPPKSSRSMLHKKMRPAHRCKLTSRSENGKWKITKSGSKTG